MVVNALKVKCDNFSAVIGSEGLQIIPSTFDFSPVGITSTNLGGKGRSSIH